MILFRCDSVYQLMNAIQIKISLLKNREADLILSDHTDFHQMIPRLKQTGLFRNIFPLSSKEDAQKYWDLSKKEKQEISHNPETFADISFLNGEYTDFYISFDTAYAKLMYYAMVKKGMQLKVHLFEDGMATYICDVEKRCGEDGMDHKYYGEKAFLRNIEQLLLYAPGLFTGPIPKFPIRPIPAISYEQKEVCDLYIKIFGMPDFPEEPYVFLEEAFVDDQIPSNDLELCMELAEIIGKENMIVKLHPRNRMNRFKEYGFKTMEQSSVPWEIFLMCNDIQKKIMFTISSNASITSKLIFHKNMNTVMLYNMFIGKTWLMTNKNFEQYHNQALREFNKERKCIYCPKSFQEVREILLYIGGLERIGL